MQSECIHQAGVGEDILMKAQAPTADLEIAKATSRARVLVLIGAFVSFLFSVSLWFMGMRDEGLFVGLWVPSILGLGNLMMPARS